MRANKYPAMTKPKENGSVTMASNEKRIVTIIGARDGIKSIGCLIEVSIPFEIESVDSDTA